MNQNSQPISKFMKFLQFPLIRIFLGFFVLLFFGSIFQIGTERIIGHEPALANIISVIITSAAFFFAYYGFVHLIERRNVSELSFSSAWQELASGALIGAMLFSTTIGLIWVLGFYHISGINEWSVITPWLVLSIVSSISEELLIRGILFRIMEESLGTWIALGITALIFGLLHLGNPNATLWGAIAISIEAGVMLAAAFVYTRRLWLPIAIHFAWNFTQGAIFGVTVSGNEAKGVFQSTLSGPTLLSGGDFGAEASIFAVVICLTAGIWFVWKSYKQGKFIQPFWTRKSTS